MPSARDPGVASSGRGCVTIPAHLWYPSRVTPAQPDRTTSGSAAPHHPQGRLGPPDDPGALPVTAVVPIKALDVAKSRLALAERDRRRLALAFASDTLAALGGCPDVGTVIVVTADPEISALATSHGARVVPDHTDSIDAAVASAVLATAPHAIASADASADQCAAEGERLHVISEAGVLVTPADLPCLRADDVTDVLRQAAAHRGAFVPDRSGTGTTMVVFAAGEPVVTAYGVGSAARHTGLGLEAVSAPVRARHDVDTLEDLREAAALGLGAATSEVMRAILAHGRVDAAPALAVPHDAGRALVDEGADKEAGDPAGGTAYALERSP